jgi:hypothetical protein
MNPSAEMMQFTDTESPELTEYHPVNRWAVASAVLGILSIPAVFIPMLLVIPIVGIIASLIAARQLSSRESIQTGRAAAKVGAFLCITIGVWVCTALVYRQTALTNQARQYAEEWFELLRNGKFYEAHQLVLPDERRVAAGASLEEHYKPRDRIVHAHESGESHSHHDPEDVMEAMEPLPHEQFRQFFDVSPAKRLKEIGSQATYEYLGTIKQSPVTATQVMVTQNFRIRYQEDGRERQFVISIELERMMYNQVASWRVNKIEDAKTG